VTGSGAGTSRRRKARSTGGRVRPPVSARKECTGRAVRLGTMGLLACLATMLPGCSSDEITFPENRRPLLYLVLNEVAPAGGGDVVQPALLLRQIRADSAVFVDGAEFRMTRISDGAEFHWRNDRLFGSGPFEDLGSPEPAEGNYLMADSTTDRGLGREALEPGGRYRLRITAGDDQLTGTVTIPDTFSVTVRQREGDPVAVWPRVDGAAGYSVSGRSGSPGSAVLQTDTTAPLDPAVDTFTVRALEPQSFRFLSDPNAERAGIEGGLGLFGAIQTVRVNAPAP